MISHHVCSRCGRRPPFGFLPLPLETERCTDCFTVWPIRPLSLPISLLQPGSRLLCCGDFLSLRLFLRKIISFSAFCRSSEMVVFLLLTPVPRVKVTLLPLPTRLPFFGMTFLLLLRLGIWFFFSGFFRTGGLFISKSYCLSSSFTLVALGVEFAASSEPSLSPFRDTLLDSLLPENNRTYFSPPYSSPSLELSLQTCFLTSHP